MKIITKFDLLNEIKHSKNGVSASELIIHMIKKFPILLVHPFGTLLPPIVLNSKKGILFNFTLYAIAGISIYTCSDYLTKKGKESYKIEADDNLRKLVNALNGLEVKTSKELLKESKVNELNYKLEYVDDKKIPKIKQYKYIDIPLSNGYEETLLQEHIIGDNSYELSVNSPIKKMNFKLIRNNI